MWKLTFYKNIVITATIAKSKQYHQNMKLAFFAQKYTIQVNLNFFCRIKMG